mmetsp:Transcript_8189/g.23498  ORF Transcript_8189/g.23498 Transcript_8189/m.23498 type:complete len:852 (-) Transcript_8189:405-2960(-)
MMCRTAQLLFHAAVVSLHLQFFVLAARDLLQASTQPPQQFSVLRTGTCMSAGLYPIDTAEECKLASRQLQISGLSAQQAQLEVQDVNENFQDKAPYGCAVFSFQDLGSDSDSPQLILNLYPSPALCSAVGGAFQCLCRTHAPQSINPAGLTPAPLALNISANYSQIGAGTCEASGLYPVDSAAECQGVSAQLPVLVGQDTPLELVGDDFKGSVAFGCSLFHDLQDGAVSRLLFNSHLSGAKCGAFAGFQCVCRDVPLTVNGSELPQTSGVSSSDGNHSSQTSKSDMNRQDDQELDSAPSSTLDPDNTVSVIASPPPSEFTPSPTQQPPATPQASAATTEAGAATTHSTPSPTEQPATDPTNTEAPSPTPAPRFPVDLNGYCTETGCGSQRLPAPECAASHLQCQKSCNGTWCPTTSYCSWRLCVGPAYRSRWCNSEESSCSQCGGSWCPGAPPSSAAVKNSDPPKPSTPQDPPSTQPAALPTSISTQQPGYCSWSQCDGVATGGARCGATRHPCEHDCGGEWCTEVRGFCTASGCGSTIWNSTWCGRSSVHCTSDCGGVWCTPASSLVPSPSRSSNSTIQPRANAPTSNSEASVKQFDDAEGHSNALGNTASSDFAGGSRPRSSPVITIPEDGEPSSPSSAPQTAFPGNCSSSNCTRLTDDRCGRSRANCMECNSTGCSMSGDGGCAGENCRSTGPVPRNCTRSDSDCQPSCTNGTLCLSPGPLLPLAESPPHPQLQSVDLINGLSAESNGAAGGTKQAPSGSQPLGRGSSQGNLELGHCTWGGCDDATMDAATLWCGESKQQCLICGGSWCPVNGYCAWGTCRGTPQGPRWCSTARSRCTGGCGGTWCSA